MLFNVWLTPAIRYGAMKRLLSMYDFSSLEAHEYALTLFVFF